MIATIKSHQTGHTFRLHPSIFHKLKLSQGQSYDWRHGLQVVQGKATTKGVHKAELSVPAKIMKRWSIPEGVTLHVWRQGHQIRLGPMIGIFVKPDFISKIKRGDIPVAARKYVQANQKSRCLVSFFSKGHIHWPTKQVSAYVRQPHNQKWTLARIPIPDVIYDRFAEDDDTSKNTQALRRKFRAHPQIALINEKKLEKWSLYKKLLKHDSIRKYLPSTVYVKNLNDCLSMLAKHRFIFVKSSAGSSGKQVISILKKDDNYDVTYYEEEIKNKKFKSEKKLTEFVQRFRQRNKQIIIQPGIHLLKYKGCPLDVRIQLNKDGQGRWQAIYGQARVARRKSTITSYALGGKLYNYEHVRPSLQKKYNSSIPSYKKLSTVAIQIAYLIEKEIGSFGEIGMDLAIDTSGRIWFLEGNSKPTKNPVQGLEDTRGISPQFINILEYAKYLTGVYRE